jgi:predicted RNA-binding protein with RPS1 domain
MTRLSRGDEVEFVVTGAQHYGLLIETVAGEKGWIEADHLSANKLAREDWPQAGERLRGLVLGYANGGRIRVCMREVDGRPSPESWPRADPQR